MAVDMFLKIDDIKGDSIDHKHAGEIEVLSWSWGVTQTGTTHSGTGGGAGKANVHDVTVTKWVDSASPKLLLNCCTGKHLKEANLVVRKAGDKPLEYVKMKLEDLLITSVQTGGSGGDDRLQETLSLNFAKIEFNYVPQKKDGSGDAPIPMKFDISTNTKL